MLLLTALAALAADPLSMSASVHSLDNGLTVVLAEDRRSDTIALHLHYGVGGRDEQPGEFGCAHLFEHLMFEGSANIPNNAFDTWLTEAGGWNNAFTSEDQTAYHMAFPSGALDLALFLESDRMGFLDAGLDQANLDNQIKVVLQERAEGYADPHGRDYDALTRLSYSQGHPYQHPVIGTIADVEGFELPAVTDFWNRWYSPSNAILVLVGNFEEAEALERVQHWFSDVPARPAAERVSKDFEGPRDPTDLPAREGVVFDEVPDRTRFLTWAIPGVSHADSEALEVLSWVLSGGRGTRLEDALYYERNLTTDATAYAWASDLDGSFIVEATTNRKRTTAVDRVTRRVIDSLVDEPPTALELDRAKQSIYASLADSMEMPEGRAEQLAECMRITGKPNCLPEKWARIQAVTAADVQRVAATWLAPGKEIGLTVLPSGARAVPANAVTVELP